MVLFKKKDQKPVPPEVARYVSDLKEKQEYWKTRNQEIDIKKYPENFDDEMLEWKNSINQLERKRIREGKRKVIFPPEE
jgi:hypothetical protein